MGVIDYKNGENLANFEMFPSFFCHVYWYAKEPTIVVG